MSKLFAKSSGRGGARSGSGLKSAPIEIGPRVKRRTSGQGHQAQSSAKEHEEGEESSDPMSMSPTHHIVRLLRMGIFMSRDLARACAKVKGAGDWPAPSVW